jgi:NAD(P)-dependent dehydrogenase (short-subunit alcohol dehydrogenase family)
MNTEAPQPGESIRFDGLVAVVTGAGRGLGRSFALALAARGASVVVNDIGVSADADRYARLGADAADFGTDALAGNVADVVVDEIRSGGGSAQPDTSDVSREDGAASIIKTAISGFGRVDIVINNAGIVPFAPFEDSRLDDLQVALNVHVGGTFNVTRAAWPIMREQGFGRVLNVCSIEGVLVGNASFAAYAAAKGGMMGLTRSLAAEGAPLGIGVNGILPGATTRGNVSVSTGYKRNTSIDRSPELVAPAAAWLVHPDCTASGQFFAATAGSMRSVFMSAALGYQSAHPRELTVEVIRDHWPEIQSHQGSIAPRNIKEYNDFRTRIYNDIASSD